MWCWMVHGWVFALELGTTVFCHLGDRNLVLVPKQTADETALPALLYNNLRLEL